MCLGADVCPSTHTMPSLGLIKVKGRESIDGLLGPSFEPPHHPLPILTRMITETLLTYLLTQCVYSLFIGQWWQGLKLRCWPACWWPLTGLSFTYCQMEKVRLQEECVPYLESQCPSSLTSYLISFCLTFLVLDNNSTYLISYQIA